MYELADFAPARRRDLIGYYASTMRFALHSLHNTENTRDLFALVSSTVKFDADFPCILFLSN